MLWNLRWAQGRGLCFVTSVPLPFHSAGSSGDLPRCLTCTASKVHRRCHFSSTPLLGGGRARVDSLGITVTGVARSNYWCSGSGDRCAITRVILERTISYNYLDSHRSGLRARHQLGLAHG